MDKELKPCPFCGGEATYYDDEKEYACCRNAYCPLWEHLPIQAWNTRVEKKELDEGEVAKVIEPLLIHIKECSDTTEGVIDCLKEQTIKAICQTFKPVVDVEEIIHIINGKKMKYYERANCVWEGIAYWDFDKVAQAIADHLNNQKRGME